MINLRQLYRKEMFFPGWVGVAINPFYFARRGLAWAVRRHASMMHGRLLDVGCGTKPYESVFQVDAYVGLEIDSQHSRQRGIADAFYDGNEFPFPSDTFDAVLCNQVLEHVFTPDLFLQEVRRVLKPGGRLMLTVPFVWDEHEQPYDFARYSSFGLRALIERNGLHIVLQEKLVKDASVIFQVANAYLFKVTASWPPLVRLVLCMPVVTLLNLTGLLASALLPHNDDLFLDQLVIAEKRC